MSKTTATPTPDEWETNYVENVGRIDQTQKPVIKIVIGEGSDMEIPFTASRQGSIVATQDAEGKTIEWMTVKADNGTHYWHALLPS